MKLIQFLVLPLLTFDLSTRVVKLNLFKADEVKFFSSDRPVIPIGDDLEKIFKLESFIFPFSKDLLLLGIDQDISRVSVNAVNEMIVSNAIDVVISSSREQLESLKESLLGAV